MMRRARSRPVLTYAQLDALVRKYAARDNPYDQRVAAMFREQRDKLALGQARHAARLWNQSATKGRRAR
jgi:hypothetical protein